MIWTPECIAQLKHAWSCGDSASVIGTDMGVSRSSILGKVHRLKLPLRRMSKDLRFEKPRMSRSKSAVAARKAARFNVMTVKKIEPRVTKINFKKHVEPTKTELRAMLTEAVRNTAVL